MRRLPVYIAILALTVFDAIATGYGVSGGHIGEGNPIANFLFSISVPGTCIVAVVWTGVLLYFVATQPHKWIPYALGLILAVKVAIAGMHLYWIAHVL